MKYSDLLNMPFIPNLLKVSVRKNNDLAYEWMGFLHVDFKDNCAIHKAFSKLSSDGFSLKGLPKREVVALVLILSCNE